MKGIELEKAYNPGEFEQRIYESWQQTQSFKPAEQRGKSHPFSVVIPPPNVTGVLHIGHGLNNMLQDIIVRYHRMRGDDTLWLPGTDHAGIATQHVVESRLKEEGLNRRDLGREAFIQRAWQIKEAHHEVIVRQQKRLGNSTDWDRERFTLDEGLSRAVREVFVRLYEKGLIYRGNYLVNWCPSCMTALADDEVTHIETAGGMYHIWYELADGATFPSVELEDGSVFEGGNRIEIATTRPETLLGDTAVAVHPDDPRYKALVGLRVKLPLTDRTIPIVADSYVDPSFGTGAVKITPAHDPNDWEVAQRCNLEIRNILRPDGSLNDEVPEKYRGMSRKQAREAVVRDLEAQGLFKGKKALNHAVGHCYRCHAIVEPYVSNQWFVRMRPLADKALEAWKKGEIVFYPRKWENTYARWMERIRDWCISRQLWWGHRIPVWYCKSCSKTIVSREDAEVCPECGSRDLEQDPDVLDTWFSSWLWPFSSLGWPEKTPDFTRFYPTQALVTAYDIIFFWVSRMVMAGLEFTGRVPFRDIYIHGLVRDRRGRKMSKSLGNGLDPQELIDEYGSDAIRFTLGFLCAQGQDVLVDKESFKLGSRFANKIWNASRYILGNLEGRTLVPVSDGMLSELDRWIIAELDGCARSMRTALESYRYNDGAQALYEYFWNEFCDWYVEATKLSFKSDDEAEKDRAVTVLLCVLEESLRLLHPYLPFVTEEIYAKLPREELRAVRNAAAGKLFPLDEHEGLLIRAPYPAPSDIRADSVVQARFDVLRELIRSVRTLRVECGIAADIKIGLSISIVPGSKAEVCREKTDIIALLAGAHSVVFSDQRPKETVGAVGEGFEVFIVFEGSIDVSSVAEHFIREIDKERASASRMEAKLAGPFSKNAPKAIVAAEKEKLAVLTDRIEKLETYLKNLNLQGG